jgi:hypothetical protein
LLVVMQAQALSGSIASWGGNSTNQVAGIPDRYRQPRRTESSQPTQTSLTVLFENL